MFCPDPKAIILIKIIRGDSAFISQRPGVETTFQGCRFALGIRNAHDKSMRLAMTVGYRSW
jgi:hypothetical protein